MTRYTADDRKLFLTGSLYRITLSRVYVNEHSAASLGLQKWRGCNRPKFLSEEISCTTCITRLLCRNLEIGVSTPPMRWGGVFWYGGKKWGVQIGGSGPHGTPPPRGEALVIIDQPSCVRRVKRQSHCFA